MTTTLTPRPTFAEEATVTAGEVETGDWLVEILPHGAVGHVLVEQLVNGNTEGPSFQSNWNDRPICLGRVRITLANGRKPLLLVGHPVVICKRLT